jgi:type II secretory ATPase GspE/PulE/Tfp pilus assembly ATPase PilB-like protein
MYSCLEILNDPGKSLVTIEDPVERRIPGVNQVQVEPKIGFHFVDALRGVLRQDPNIMMIGEIRDPETAHIGIRAGRTGVLVLSTMHSNDAAASIDMLRDFNISPLFIADSIQAILSQRLMRRVCDHCRVTYQPTDKDVRSLGMDPAEAQTLTLARGAGCDVCFRTGYQGRVGVFEVLRMTEELRQAIIANQSRSQLVQLARRHGMRTMQEVAIQKVLAGLTTVEELDRVLRSAAEV